MTKAKINEAAINATNNGEDLSLAQAVEWMHDYGLMTYAEYKTFLQALNDIYEARTA
jgi:hypothetical protein